MAKSDPVNVVLVYTAVALDPEDFIKVSKRVKAVADNISIYVAEFGGAT